MVKKNTQSEPVVMFDVIGKKKEQTIQISAKIQNRFAISGVWLKGTLHCHSDRPGNKEWLFGIVEHYKNMGYDYIVGMDHDKIVPLKSDADFVVIPGAEISCGGHLIALGIHEIPEGIQGETRCITISHMIGKIKKMGGVTVLAHPFKSGYKYQELIELCEAGLDGIETVNSNVRGKGADEGRADQIWQMLLRDGWNLTPFGNDDAHGPHENYIESGWGGYSSCGLDRTACGRIFDKRYFGSDKK